MPLFTEWRLDALAASDAQAAWASGDWAGVAAALIDDAARTGRAAMLAPLLEQEARNDQDSLLLPNAMAIARLDDSPWRSVALGLAAMRTGQTTLHLQQSLERLAEVDPATSAMVGLCLAWRLVDRGHWREAARFDAIARSSLESPILEAPQSERLRAPIHAVHAFIAWSLDDDDHAVERLQQLLNGPLGGGTLGRQHALPLTALGRIHAGRGAWREATACLARAARLTPRGALEASVTTQALLALARYRVGDWHGAALESASAQEACAASTSPTLASIGAALGALQHALVGESAAARRDIDRARQALQRRRSIIAEAIVLHARIISAIAARDWSALHGIVHVEGDAGYRLLYSQHEWLALDAFARYHDGDLVGLRALLDGWPGAVESAYYWTMRGLLADAEGDTASALRGADRAKATSSLDDDPLGRAWTRWAIGLIESRHRDPDGGRRELEQANAVLVRLGAEGFATYTASLMRRSEQLPPPETLEALGGLTPQQRKVADLVADGWTSAEIAAQLFLSKRTIDFHVANVVERLALANRREIKRVIDAARQL